MTNDKWFESWFDTQYYHLLYGHRDYDEAHDFVQRLIKYVNPPKQAHFCDLACGVGRHAKFIADLNYQVTGFDLSENNIKQANRISHPNLTFKVQDMRTPFGQGRFDYVLNLFTSFGYFETDEDHETTLLNVANSLKDDGVFIVDFLNTQVVRNSLVRSTEQTVGGVRFEIRRVLSEQHVIKEVKVTDGDQIHYYEERVRLFDLTDFDDMFEGVGLSRQVVFGDYNLGTFESASSPRMIMIAEKK